MPVTPLGNTASITAASVQNLYEDVRGVVNAITKSRMARGSLGPQHLPSLVVASGYREVTANSTIATAPAGFVDNSAAEIAADWKDLDGTGGVANWQVDNGGAGWSLPICTLVSFFSGYISNYATVPDLDHQVWFNLYHRKAGANDIKVRYSRGVWAQTIGPTVGETCTIWRAETLASAQTLNRIGVFAALNRGGSAGAVPNLILHSGYIGFFALYRES